MKANQIKVSELEFFLSLRIGRSGGRSSKLFHSYLFFPFKGFPSESLSRALTSLLSGHSLLHNFRQSFSTTLGAREHVRPVPSGSTSSPTTTPSSTTIAKRFVLNEFYTHKGANAHTLGSISPFPLFIAFSSFLFFNTGIYFILFSFLMFT